MCGRFVVTTEPAVLAKKINAIDEAVWATKGTAPSLQVPNYNVAPTATIATVVSRHSEPDDRPSRRVRLMRWGLIPPWAKAGPDGAPEATGLMLINARADKIATSPAFRSSAKSKRCLIPMDGYYEWRVNDADAGEKSRKTPFFMYRDDGKSLFVAGLWAAWKPGGNLREAGAPLLSCTIVTTDAPGALGEIHDRMPLVMPESDWDRWLDPDVPVDERLLSRPPDVHGIRMRQVSTRVNNVRNNGPELIEPVGSQPEQTLL
jgi:putative SOS response-associated peptidase YedK